MAKAIKLSDSEQVDQHIKQLEPGIGKTVAAILKILLASHKDLGQRIKWNNPSIYYTGEMAPFDPKEYKREIVVFNLFKGRIMLVFPSGARIKDPSGLLQGEYKDGRRTIVFEDIKAVKASEKALQGLIKDWVKGVDK